MDVLTLTTENFEIVTNGNLPVLVDFWADWCGPCRMVSPIVDELAAENDEFRVGKINVDEQPELAQRFGIMSIPTLMVFRNGKQVQKSVGVKSKKEILALI